MNKVGEILVKMFVVLALLALISIGAQMLEIFRAWDAEEYEEDQEMIIEVRSR
jgi:hypothetical protein